MSGQDDGLMSEVSKAGLMLECDTGLWSHVQRKGAKGWSYTQETQEQGVRVCAKEGRATAPLTVPSASRSDKHYKSQGQARQVLRTLREPELNGWECA